MFHRKLFLQVAIMSGAALSQAIILPTDPAISYQGRIDASHKDRVLFDWPGITIYTMISGTSVQGIFEGINAFDAFIDGVPAGTFITMSGKSTIPIARNLSDRTHRLLIVKRSESAGAPTAFYGFILDKDKTLSVPPPLANRRIEFIGDSYTAGFANEYLGRECASGKEDSILLSATNTNKAFGSIVAKAFNAHYQINAVSGKGLIRNYNGIDKGREFPACYERTLVSTVNNPTPPGKWNFSRWKADIVVIGLGINDFQGNEPHADTAAFDAAYHALIVKLQKQYPNVKIICCATKVWPNDALIPRVKAIVDKEITSGNSSVRYFEYFTENGALFGHPHIHDHRTIANGLIPVVAELTGWRRTDMDRGK